MSQKIPLNEMLAAIDRKDKGFYSRLNDEQKKEFSAWLCMRWASATTTYSEQYMLMVNDFVNQNFNDLKNHPELQWKLMTLAGVGRTVRHEWIKPPKKTKKNKVQEFVSNLYPHFNDEELTLFLSINTKDQLKDLAKEHGFDDKEIKEIFKK